MSGTQQMTRQNKTRHRRNARRKGTPMLLLTTWQNLEDETMHSKGRHRRNLKKKKKKKK